MDQLLGDAKLLVQRLRHHDSAADSLISDATNLEAKLLAMREYREEVNKLNDIARHRPRSTLILGSKLENQRIQDLEHENRELHLSLTEHQSALELIMNKYREQVLNLLSHKGLNKTALEHMNKNSGDIGILTEKITEMAAVMQRAANADDEMQSLDAETVAKLKFENKALRELLHISGHPKKEIEKLKILDKYKNEGKLGGSLTSLLSDTASLELDSSADEMENKTGTVKRNTKAVCGNANNGNGKDNIMINGRSSELSVEESLQIFDNVMDNYVSDLDLNDDEKPDDKAFVNEVIESPHNASKENAEKNDIFKELEQITSAENENVLLSNENNLSNSVDNNIETIDSSSSLDIVEDESEKEFEEAVSSSEVSEEKESVEDELLELYNSEGRLLEGADDVYTKKGSPFDGKLSGMKIRKSSKQKKVIQANLKTFFEKESCSEDQFPEEIPIEIDTEVSKNDKDVLDGMMGQLESNLDNDTSGRVDFLNEKEKLNSSSVKCKSKDGDTELEDMKVEEDQLHEPKGTSLENLKDPSENEITATSSGNAAFDKGPTIDESEISENDLTADKAKVINVDDKPGKHTTEGAKENEQDDSVDSGRSSLSNDASFAKKTTHRTVELDFSDSDSDDTEVMIEDQFADIIAEANDDSSSGSSSDYSDHEPDFEELEPTEEELVGDLEEGGEFVISQWIRPKVEYDHLDESWTEGDNIQDMNKQTSNKNDVDDMHEQEGIVSSLECQQIENVRSDGESKSTNDEDFSFLQASYQIDQFTGGSIKAKYAKRKSYQNANKASAIKLSSNVNPSKTDSDCDLNLQREEASARVDADKASASDDADKASARDDADKASDDADKASARDDADKASASDDADKASVRDDADKASASDDADKASASGEAMGDKVEKSSENTQITSAKSSESSISSNEDAQSSSNDSSSDKTTSESSSGEIDPLDFKRRLSVHPGPANAQTDCVEHLNELLSDLDAKLALSDGEDDFSED